MALKSTQNTPIEGFWHWLRESIGRTLYLDVTSGHTVFNSSNPIHINLFRWLWPPIVQKELDKFAVEWNSHRLRLQRNKALPSGATPISLYMCPEETNGIPLFNPVSPNLIAALRQHNLPNSRKEAFQWVPDAFDEIAGPVYEANCADILVVTSKNAWTVFQRMVTALLISAPADAWVVLC
ncbi:hypothetical protein SISNIDRAFT_489401 [Sistotremastrum niveocremeum HHB9708]|uniref:Integrase core domain-containing protein n=1 Tax=Sistotremastrum niveocremeum HHB9708 TaxID=1314777 RepID=A0A164PZJ5_9AGAM|nr:hypothetical protein SISNIDRAFT_489401 [Sistotremastrum niveocremeum HHB9708]